MKYTLIIALVVIASIFNSYGQRSPATYQDWGTNVWMGSYNQFRLSENFYYSAEFHYRRTQDGNTPYIGRLAQIYNRHGLTYMLSKNFNATLGGVLRLNFAPSMDDESIDPLVHEPRIWHEYLFMSPFPRFQVYHRIRIEHRWSKSNSTDAEWIFRNRWRYKYYMKIPINKPQLVPGALYVNPEVELIMQSGKPVIDSPMEDLRISMAASYIANPRVTYSAGMMFTTGQNLEDGSNYTRRWIVRLSAYIALDFRKETKKIPSIKLSD